jgi:hypothetical protein
MLNALDRVLQDEPKDLPEDLATFDDWGHLTRRRRAQLEAYGVNRTLWRSHASVIREASVFASRYAEYRREGRLDHGFPLLPYLYPLALREEIRMQLVEDCWGPKASGCGWGTLREVPLLAPLRQEIRWKSDQHRAVG